MLNRLYIQNYALIDTLDISFGKGLNIMTGETGAGKSIVLGALSLILGQRAENRFLFDEGRKCVIEGFFEVGAYGLEDFFEVYDLDFEQETILRREFGADGKSRAFINDTPVNLQILKAFSEKLIDIHSQHATLQVADADFQLLILDSVAGQIPVQKQFSNLLGQNKKTKSELAKRKELAGQRAAEADYKQFLYDELLAAKPVKGEAMELEQELDQLEHAGEIRESLFGAVHHLRDGEVNLELLLKEAMQMLARASQHMPLLHTQEDRLRSSMIELKDLADELESQADSVMVDEERLQFVQDRISTLYALQQKHRLSDPDELVNRQEELEKELSAGIQDDQEIEELRRTCQAQLSQLRGLSASLRKGREQAIPKVREKILNILEKVGMPGSQLDIRLDTLPEDAFRSDGGDAINFLFSSNKGQAPQPVGKIASGGELSRLMLAIKALIAEHTALPTIIFDEIDTGISGEVALRVGDILAQLGERMQVIAISHLPQIASRGIAHYKVFKTEESGKTSTQMVLLDKQARIMEIAQMLSGSDPGSAALEHARTLLGAQVS